MSSDEEPDGSKSIDLSLPTPRAGGFPATDDRIGLGSDNDRCGIGGVDLPLRAMGVADDEQASSIAPIYCRWPWEGLICGHHHGSGD